MSSLHPVEPAAFTASVVVRAKNKQATIERTLRALRAQTVQAQVIVVDSGSTDSTLDIAAVISNHENARVRERARDASA